MYRKIILLLVLSFSVLTGCTKGDETAPNQANVLAAEAVITAFDGQGLELTQAEVRPESIFQIELNGQVPLVFLLNGEEISLYPFPEAKEREAGWNDFEQRTRTADLVPYKAYQKESVLLFYVQDSGGAVEQELDDKISRAIAAMLSPADKDA